MLPLTVNAVLVNTVSIADKTPTGRRRSDPWSMPVVPAGSRSGKTTWP
jgi:hypothetical protein